MLRLSIVIITWKAKELLRRCLQSIYRETTQTLFDVILIDNASGDGTLEMLASEFPAVKVIRNAHNRGVAPARNQGLKIAEGEFILILDVDTEITKAALDKMVAFMNRHSTIGILGAKLFFGDGSVQDSCKRYPTVLTPFLRRLDFIPAVKHLPAYRYQTMADWNHDSTIEVDYLIGACQMIRRTVFSEIGYLDDKIFYGPEDIDFCLRARQADWKIVYYHEAEILHYHQRITRKLFSAITFKHISGLIYFFRKHHYLFSPPLPRTLLIPFPDAAKQNGFAPKPHAQKS
ncbi:MAG: glycosyltransferase family 2 protein [Rhizobacter sp.]|nr:glycosyltransferase family 2 protein [Chlorobiales bacterium]